MAVAMTGAVMNRARCVVPSHTIYPVARPCAVRTHHSQSHKAARLPSRLLRPAFNTAAAERAVLGLWPSIRPVTCIDSELGSTLTVRRAHRELLAAACIDINVVRKVIVTPHCARRRSSPHRYARRPGPTLSMPYLGARSMLVLRQPSGEVDGNTVFRGKRTTGDLTLCTVN